MKIKNLRLKLSNCLNILLPGERMNAGAEMVQVAILVAIAIALGLIFKNEITAFINRTFENLNGGFD